MVAWYTVSAQSIRTSDILGHLTSCSSIRGSCRPKVGTRRGSGLIHRRGESVASPSSSSSCCLPLGRVILSSSDLMRGACWMLTNTDTHNWFQCREKDVLSHRWDIYVTFLCKAQGLSQERGSGRARGQGRPERNSVFWIGQDGCMLELTAAVVACRRPAQDGASQHASIGGAHEPLTPN